MYKLSALAICLGLQLAGCGDKHTELPVTRGDIAKPITFNLPGSVFRLETKRNETTYGKTDYTFVPTAWKPKGWSLWVAANVYSDARHPGNSTDWKTRWKEAKAGVDRATGDDQFLNGIKEFITVNKVDLQINYMGYDYLPKSLVDDYPRSRGLYFTEYGEKCEKGFKRCVDNYYLSPLERYSGGPRMAYKDWVEPYFHFGSDPISKSDQEMFINKGGQAGEKSEFYDFWPTMVFLVNPEGQAVKAWMPQTQNAASVGDVEAALIKEMKLSDAKINQENMMYQPTTVAYYGQFFIEGGIENLLQTMNGILSK